MRLVRVILSIVILVLSTCVAASARDASPVRVLMEKTGFSNQLETFERLTASDMAGPIVMLGILIESDLIAIDQFASEIFQKDRMRAELEEAFASSLTDSQIDRMLEFYLSGLGQKIDNARTAALSPETMVRRPEDLAKIRSEMERNPDRKRLLQKVVELTRTTEFIALVFVDPINSFASGVASTDAPIGATLLLSVKMLLAPNKSSVLEMMRQEVLNEYAYLLRDVSNDELRTYVEFLKSEEAVILNKNRIPIFERIYLDRYFRLGTKLGEYRTEERL